MTSRFLELPDLHEGVRALLVEKDLRPAWQPAKLADVTPAMVEALFSSETTIDASLATREQMQAARV